MFSQVFIQFGEAALSVIISQYALWHGYPSTPHSRHAPPPGTRHGIYPLPCDWHLVVITGNLFKRVGGWFVRVTLVVACSFLPQNLGGGRDLWIAFLLENECNLRGVDNRRQWDTQILLAGKKLDFMHSQMVATQKISPSLVLAPHNSHLV